MTFSRIAREAEEFDSALRDASAGGAHVDELQLAAALSGQNVCPDAAFTADLRASLLQAAREGALVAAPPIRPSRHHKRRWTLVAPAVAVTLTAGGVAFALTGLQTTGHTPVPASSSAASVLSTAHARLQDISQEIRSGRATETSLTSLNAQASQLQDMLVSEYGAGSNPQAIRDLHDFVVSAITQLAALRAQVPANLTMLYASTMQTLVDIAKRAESACPACNLTPVRVPAGPTVGPSAPVSTVPGTVARYQAFG